MLDFTQCNADFTTGVAKDHRHFAYLAQFSDVIFLQEVKNIDVQAALPEGWKALQNQSTKAKAGVAIAYNTAKVSHSNFRLRVGVAPYIRGRRIGMEIRYIATVNLFDLEADEKFYGISAHVPPQRFKVLQPQMLRKIRNIARNHPRTVLGSDVNGPYKVAAAKMGLRGYGKGIDGIFVGPYVSGSGPMRVSNWGKKNGLTDHITVTKGLTSK